MLFEVLGLGCGSGPLTGRYFPPIGGFLYFLRPGTTKLPLVPGAAAPRRRARAPRSTSLLYAALVVAARARAGRAGAGAARSSLPLAVLVPLLGVARQDDLPRRARRALLGRRSSASPSRGDWIAGAKAVQLALWFWAGFSKLNHHFPTVVCVMTSNSPFTRFAVAAQADVPRAIPTTCARRGSATSMAHAGTALEFGVPIAFLLDAAAARRRSSASC